MLEDVSMIGPPGFATFWNKTQNMAQLRIKGIAARAAMPYTVKP